MSVTLTTTMVKEVEAEEVELEVGVTEEYPNSAVEIFGQTVGLLEDQGWSLSDAD